MSEKKKNAGLNEIRTHEPLRYRCSALLTEPSSQLEAGHIVSSQYARRSWKYKWIYEISYIWTTEEDMKAWLIIAGFNIHNCF